MGDMLVDMPESRNFKLIEKQYELIEQAIGVSWGGYNYYWITTVL